MTKLLRAAKKLGCSVERTSGGHWKVITPSGEVIIAAFSPRSAKSVHDIRHRLRRAGVDI
jgi:hypothetical protein